MASSALHETWRRDIITGFVFYRLGACIQQNEPRYKTGVSPAFVGHAGARLIEDWFFLVNNRQGYDDLTDIYRAYVPYRFGSLAALKPGGIMNRGGDLNLTGRYFYPDIVIYHPVMQHLGAKVEPDGKKLIFPPLSFPQLNNFYRGSVPDDLKKGVFNPAQTEVIDQLAKVYCSLPAGDVVIIASCLSMEHTVDAVDAEFNIWHKDYNDLLGILSEDITEAKAERIPELAKQAYFCVEQVKYKIDGYENLERIRVKLEAMSANPIAQHIKDNLYPLSVLPRQLTKRLEISNTLDYFMAFTCKILETLGFQSRTIDSRKNRESMDRLSRIDNFKSIAGRSLAEPFEIAKSEKGSSNFRRTSNMLRSLHRVISDCLRNLDLPYSHDPAFWDQFKQE